MAKKILKKIAHSIVKAKKAASKKAGPLKKAPVLKASAAKAKAAHKASAKPKPSVKKATAARDSKKLAKKAALVAKPLAKKGLSLKAKSQPSVSKKGAKAQPVQAPATAPAASAKISTKAAATAAAKKHVLAPAKVSVKVMNRCREVACDSAVVGAGYCRLHYIKNWKQLKAKEQILAEGKLDRFIEELVAKYPEKYIEAIRYDLRSEVEFAKVALDLNLVEVPAEEFASDDESVSDDGIIDSIKKESIEEIEEF